MSWRDRYQQASFRGAAFFVESAEGSHGRRQAVHEHAQRDIPYTEDMGRRAREFTIDGYLVGADYDIALKALITACETAGPGQLVHPYRGQMTVVCRGLTTRESSVEGRMARVSITFLEAGEASFPRAVGDSINAISRAGNIATLAAGVAFVSKFLTGGFPEFVRASATKRVQKLTTILIDQSFGMTGDAQASSEFYYLVTDLASDAYDLVTDAKLLLPRVTGVMTGIRTAFGENSFKVLTQLNQQFASSYPSATLTPSRAQDALNFESFGELVRIVSISEAAKAAVVTEYDSHQEAISARDLILDQIDIESERTTDDDSYTAINGLRAEVVKGVPKSGERLPQLLAYRPPMTMPSLVVAHHLYGDASRESEIAARNKPRHPGFLTGGRPLEVLSDG